MLEDIEGQERQKLWDDERTLVQFIFNQDECVVEAAAGEQERFVAAGWWSEASGVCGSVTGSKLISPLAFCHHLVRFVANAFKHGPTVLAAIPLLFGATLIAQSPDFLSCNRPVKIQSKLAVNFSIMALDASVGGQVRSDGTTHCKSLTRRRNIYPEHEFIHFSLAFQHRASSPSWYRIRARISSKEYQ